MLIIVDPQVDFVDGTLPVDGAKEAMSALGRYMKEHNGEYAVKLITADSHPYDHSSFEPCGGMWVRHCVRDSIGAAIVPDVFESVFSTSGEVAVMHKGEDKNHEEYSIFQTPGAVDKIEALIKKHHISEIDICGLAGDVCVLSTLSDAFALFPDIKFNVLVSFSPSLDGGEKLSQYINDNPRICAR